MPEFTNWMYLWIAWGIVIVHILYSVIRRVCISNKLPGEANAVKHRDHILSISLWATEIEMNKIQPRNGLLNNGRGMSNWRPAKSRRWFHFGNIWTVSIWLTFLERTTTKLLSTGLWEPLEESKHCKESRHLTKQKKQQHWESPILMALVVGKFLLCHLGQCKLRENNSQWSGLKIWSKSSGKSSSWKVRGDITERKGTGSVLSFVY